MIGALFDAGPPAAVPLVTAPLLVAAAWPPKNPPGPWLVAAVVLEAVEAPLPPVMSTTLLPPAPPGPP